MDPTTVELAALGEAHRARRREAHEGLPHRDGAQQPQMFDGPLSFLTKNEDDFTEIDRLKFQAMKWTLDKLPRARAARSSCACRRRTRSSPCYAGACRADAREDAGARTTSSTRFAVEGQADILSRASRTSRRTTSIQGAQPAARAGDGARLLLPHVPQQAAAEEGRRAHRHAPVHRRVRSGAPPVSTSSSSIASCPRRATRTRCRRSTRTSSRTTRRYIEMYRRGNAYHGAHPFYMWYWGQKRARALRQGHRRRRRQRDSAEAARLGARRDARRGDRDGRSHDGALARRSRCCIIRRSSIDGRCATMERLCSASSASAAAARRRVRRSQRRQAHPVRRRDRLRRQGRAVDAPAAAIPTSARCSCLVRPGAGNIVGRALLPEGRDVADVRSAARALHGDGYRGVPAREDARRCAGDIGAAAAATSPRQTSSEIGQLDVIINCAGLVSFNPSLESALRINVLGREARARRRAQDRRAAGARLDLLRRRQRDGEVWEDEPLVGYFPRKDRARRQQTDTLRDDDFDPSTLEIADCQKHHRSGQARAPTIARTSRSSASKGAARLQDEAPRSRRRAHDSRSPSQRERKIWMADEAHRPRHGARAATGAGPTRTRTRSRSASRSSCRIKHGARRRSCGRRSSRSALRYPFPGWNEGFNTTAPLMYLCSRGTAPYPTGDDSALDVIPVDFVAAGHDLATAAILAGEHEPSISSARPT